jgi:hypothetical protein
MTNSLKLVDFFTGFKLLLFYAVRIFFEAASKVPENRVAFLVSKDKFSVAVTFDVVLTELEEKFHVYLTQGV